MGVACAFDVLSIGTEAAAGMHEACWSEHLSEGFTSRFREFFNLSAKLDVDNSTETSIQAFVMNIPRADEG